VKDNFILKHDQKMLFAQNSLAIELTLWWQNFEVSTPLVQKPITGDDSQQAANLHLQLQQKSFLKSI
jgi:hypothetical protein